MGQMYEMWYFLLNFYLKKKSNIFGEKIYYLYFIHMKSNKMAKASTAFHPSAQTKTV